MLSFNGNSPFINISDLLIYTYIISVQEDECDS